MPCIVHLDILFIFAFSSILAHSTYKFKKKSPDQPGPFQQISFFLHVLFFLSSDGFKYLIIIIPSLFSVAHTLEEHTGLDVVFVEQHLATGFSIVNYAESPPGSCFIPSILTMDRVSICLTASSLSNTILSDIVLPCPIRIAL